MPQYRQILEQTLAQGAESDMELLDVDIDVADDRQTATARARLRETVELSGVTITAVQQSTDYFVLVDGQAVVSRSEATVETG